VLAFTMLAIGRAIGRARFLPFGVRDRALRFLFPPSKQQSREFVQPVGRALYAGNLNNYIDWSIYFFGQYERGILRFIASTLPGLAERPVFWDIGANSGQHSVFAAGLGAHVEAFEPYEPLCRQIAKSAALKPSLSIRIHPFGLANEDGAVPFNPPSNENFGTGHFGPSGSVTLPLRRGDGVDARPPDMLKIDVEGYEAEVLLGLSDTIARRRPVILCEFSERTKERTADLRLLLPSYYIPRTLKGAERPRLNPYTPLGNGEMHVFVPAERETLLASS
jgi:FkbM family methyltransferase